VPQERNQPTDRLKFQHFKTAAFCKLPQSVFGVAEVIVRQLVQAAQMRHRKQQNAARLQHPADFSDAFKGVGDVLQHLKTQNAVDSAA